MKVNPYKILLLCLLMTLLSGCHHEQADNLSSPRFPTAVVSAAVQAQTQQVAIHYAAALNSRNFSAAEQMMTPHFRATAPPSQLRDWMQQGYKPLASAHNLQFDSAQSAMQGRTIVLRAQFINKSDGKKYRTNFLLVKQGNKWLIDGIAQPATHRKPVQNTGQKSSA
jgi:hypothetical protein